MDKFDKKEFLSWLGNLKGTLMELDVCIKVCIAELKKAEWIMSELEDGMKILKDIVNNKE